MPISLGTYIRERRKILGMTQEQLAEQVGDGVRQSEISRLEHNHVSLPRRDRLECLAAALDVSIGELLIRTGWMEEGDGIATGLQEALSQSQTHEHVEAIALENLPALVETVATVRDMVAGATLALEEANRSIETVLRSVNAAGPPRSVASPKLRSMDQWETIAVWV